MRYLEKGADFSILQTLDGAVQWAPLKVGEVNTVENIGKGTPLFHNKNAEKLRFKTLSTNSPEIKISEKGGEVLIDYKSQAIKGYVEIDSASFLLESLPANKAHYTINVDTSTIQDITPLVYNEYEGVKDGAIVTFVNTGKKDMKFGPYIFVPHAYISFRWDAEGHSFNKI